ncbi:hypothetical protein O3886_09860 [Haemophilus sputorum]
MKALAVACVLTCGQSACGCPSSYPSGYSRFIHATPKGENPLNRP